MEWILAGYFKWICDKSLNNTSVFRHRKCLLTRCQFCPQQDKYNWEHPSGERDGYVDLFGK